MSERTPSEQAAIWLDKLASSLDAGDVPAATALFHENGYWRDLLTFTWTIKTLEGRSAIAGMLEATLARTRPSGFCLDGDASDDGETLEAWFTFETDRAHGQGILRLRDGRCHTLLTVMTDLKGFEERKGPTRSQGVVHKADPERETWSEARAREDTTLGDSVQPYCLIIGGGQGGVALGARLRQLDVPTIIVEKNPRIGDSWRNRYRTLVLHDPVWFDHLPYIPFPENWPVFTPKDKMGDWLEMYAKVMELTCWTSSTCKSASFDDRKKVWTVEIERNGETVVLNPKQLVFATGAYGSPRRIELAGAGRFSGTLLHSSDYQSGQKLAGQRVAVIGSASSGHDVAVDLWEAGAEVTMIQRSPTTVVKSETLMKFAFGDHYSEEALARGITTDKADMLLASVPYGLLPEGQRKLTDEARRHDAKFYERLEGVGFALDFGEDDSGLFMKALRTGSGYYIDVGASELIIDGKIKVESGVGVEGLSADGVILTDGRELPADVVIMCTGYHSMHETVAEIVSRETADRVGPCWGLGSGVKNDPGPWQGELRNMYKPTAQEALWFHGGNLALSRFYSKILALQLLARRAALI